MHRRQIRIGQMGNPVARRECHKCGQVCAANFGHSVRRTRGIQPGLFERVQGCRDRRPRRNVAHSGLCCPRDRPGGVPGPGVGSGRPFAPALKWVEKEFHFAISHSAAGRTACITSSRTRVRSRRIRLPWATPNLACSAFASSFAIEAKPPACKIAAALSSIT